MKNYPNSLKEAHNNLLNKWRAFQNTTNLEWFLKNAAYEKAYREMMDAIRIGSGWIEQGKGTPEEKNALLKDQTDVEVKFRRYYLGSRHPWDKGVIDVG